MNEMRTAMRTRYLVTLLLTAGIGFSQTPDMQPGGCVGCSSEPQSTLLFRGACGEPNLVIVTPNGNFTVPQPPDWIGQCASPIPAISPSGDRIAWSLKFRYDTETVKCDPSKKVWCDPHPRPIFKSVMGVYSLRDKTWKQYGDFCKVGSAAFSPDGKRIAFTKSGDPLCTNVFGDEKLMILDLETGEMTPVPGAGSTFFWIDQLSWSPDGKFLAGSANGPGYGKIVLIDVATGATKTITEGSDPSWSPKGDWIAYALTLQCMVIHPDGTGAKSVLDKERKWMNYTLDAPIVWSPEGDRLLLNQRQVDGTHTRVIMVDLATGHAIMKSKNGEVVMGWVPYSGR
jgi:Tol biopolymer transport system component